jgi:hypothetical protein
METKKRSRAFQFTINNYTKKELSQIVKVLDSSDEHQYCCYGLEIAPETKTKHIQGYIYFKNPKTYKGFQKYFNIQRKAKLLKFHVEPAFASVEKNQEYTRKEGDWYEYGEPPKQGSRTDLKILKERVFSDPKSSSLIIENEDLSYQQVKYVELVQKYAFKHRNPENPPRVFWVWGESGTGKTKKVFDDFGPENVYSVTDFNWLGEGYKQQEVYLIDDFRHHDIKFNTLLKMLDRYPFTLSVKGSSIPLNSPTIIITSNQSIRNTFGGKLNVFEDLEQLERRVNEYHISELKVPFQQIKTLQDF